MYGRAKTMAARMVGAGDNDDANGWTGRGDHNEVKSSSRSWSVCCCSGVSGLALEHMQQGWVDVGAATQRCWVDKKYNTTINWGDLGGRSSACHPRRGVSVVA